MTKQPFLQKIKHMIGHESFGGLLLVFCALGALVVANSPLAGWYDTFLNRTTGVIGIGSFVIEKRIIHWINDGLMAVFFFMIGLEVKRELSYGLLKTWSARILPLVAAIGGMVGPAVIYMLVIYKTPDAALLSQGWAIPAATDIAFALGVFALLAKFLPPSLRIFLLALAIFDDIGAIIIIAFFYTADLGVIQLLGAAFCLLALTLMNLSGVRKVHYFILIGLIMWAFVLKSGVHATLAGVLLALTIPTHTRQGHPLAEVLEHELHTFVNFFVLPLFAFANAGVSFAGVGVNAFLSPLTLAVALGLVLGKQIGIFGSTWLATRLRLAPMPQGATWGQIWGVTFLAGIGFTMSLFIGSLAFNDEMDVYHTSVRLGVLIGSFLSAFGGLMLLRFFAIPQNKAQSKEAA